MNEVTVNDDPADQRYDTGRTCRACGTTVWSWLSNASAEERTDKAVCVACETGNCYEARQPLLGLGMYAQTVEELLARIGARGEPPT